MLTPTNSWILDSNGNPYYDNICTLESRRRWNAATMSEEDQLIADAIYVADQERAAALRAREEREAKSLAAKAKAEEEKARAFFKMLADGEKRAAENEMEKKRGHYEMRAQAKKELKAVMKNYKSLFD